MKIFVKAIPRAKRQKVQKLPDGSFKVWLISAPEKGRANEELKKVLANYFETNVFLVKIIIGHRSRRKIVEILT